MEMGIHIWLLIGQAAQGGPAAFDPQRPEFERYAESVFAGTNPYLGQKARRELEQALASADLAPQRRLELEAHLGRELIQSGELERAIATLEAAQEHARALGLDGVQVRRTLALAYLRLAENLNCVDRHNAECCIFPLKGGAIHALREPAEKAREQYELLLEKNPEDLESRWLLNVLAMALGEYPEGVAERWRLPPQAFASQKEMAPFHDVASEVGVDKLSLAGGVAVEDWDGDGLLDILTSTSDPRGPLTCYRNRGDGTFEDRSDASRVSDQLGGLNLIAGDYDNDGDPDALVLRGGWQAEDGRIRKSLLRNDPDGIFRDLTRAAGLGNTDFPSQTATWADLDGDGWLDLYVGNESRKEEAPGADYPSQLFRSRGDGSFVEVAAQAGVRNDRYAKGVAVGDYDDDGDLDLYVSNIGPNRLYRNEGDLRFTDVAPQLGVQEPVGRSFACWFFDYDNDGSLDLLVWGYSTRAADLAAEALGRPHQGVLPCLYRNRGHGVFRNVTARVGLARPLLPMGANFGDIDNDGWLDLYLGTGEPSLVALMPNVLFWNEGGKRFLDVTAATGLGHLQKGHGIAFADFDHDGDQDIYHELGGFFPVDRFRSSMFENPGNRGHWLSLELVGTRSNRDALGARLQVVIETPAGTREIHRAPGCVSSFGGSPHRQEIGLGDATRIARLEIRWPRTSEPQVFADVPLDAFLRITEGAEAFERLERPTFRFRTPPAAGSSK